MDYKALYHLLFNACTDALEELDAQNFGLARARLIAAQQEAEDFYVTHEDSLVQATDL